MNVWDEDEPRASLPLDDVFANAPDRDRNTSASADRQIDTLRLTAEEARACSSAARSRPPSCTGPTSRRSPSATASFTASCGRAKRPNGEGIPIALKDVISTKGIETTAGSRILEGYAPVFDSTVAAKRQGAGLSVLGKTNTDEFAMGSSTENSAVGPSRNPWDPSRVPGGSGGGTAAAVSAGLAPVGARLRHGRLDQAALGTVRKRRLRPTYGSVSRYGVVAFASSLDQIGPVAKTVRDVASPFTRSSRAAILATRRRRSCPSRCGFRRASLTGVRIGVPTELNEAEGIEPGVAEPWSARLELAEARRGGRGVLASALRPVRASTYYLIAPAEASSNLARYDGVATVRGGRLELPGDGRPTRDEGFGDEQAPDHARHVCALGRLLRRLLRLGAEGADAHHRGAPRGARPLDVLACPTSPTVAFQVGERAADPLAMYARPAYDPVLPRGPAGALDPVRSLEGLPVGLQLIGPQFGENPLFRVGHALEQALGFDTVRPSACGRER